MSDAVAGDGLTGPYHNLRRMGMRVELLDRMAQRRRTELGDWDRIERIELRETSHSQLGSCPDCGLNFSRRDLVLEYDRTYGTATRYAECADCETLIVPKCTAGGVFGP